MLSQASYQGTDRHLELRILLLRKNLSQRTLARKLRCRPEYLNRVLKGQKAGHKIRQKLAEIGIPESMLPPLPSANPSENKPKSRRAAA